MKVNVILLVLQNSILLQQQCFVIITQLHLKIAKPPGLRGVYIPFIYNIVLNFQDRRRPAELSMVTTYRKGMAAAALQKLCKVGILYLVFIVIYPSNFN